MNNNTTNHILWPESKGFEPTVDTIEGEFYDLEDHVSEHSYKAVYSITEHDIQVESIEIQVGLNNLELLSTVLEWLREDILEEADDLPESNRLILQYDLDGWWYTHDGVDFQYGPLKKIRKPVRSPEDMDNQRSTSPRGPVATRRAPRKSNFKVS
ncbi:MAG: hypothetical protein NXI20_28690 [bacterium]|nr:hypothetical protein [bacterium]